MNILGISAFYHDSAASLVRDGTIVAAAQEERFTRKRGDSRFPHEAIRFCLKEGGIEVHDLDWIAFYDKPFLKFERLLASYLAYAPSGIRSFLRSMPSWIKQKLWIREHIQDTLGFEGTVLFPEHHESHAASAFFPSPFQEAAILTLDGVGEWATTSYGVGRDNRIQLQGELQFPHSLGLLYSALTSYLGFAINLDEGKVMGLAPYGEPRYREKILTELMDLKEDGSFRLNMGYFNYAAGLTMTNARFNRLLKGPPRGTKEPITQRHMDIARSLQEVTEEVMLRMARHLHRLTGQRNLCLAGGVALNCVANGRILREGPFEKIWIQPAAGDAGGALGAALLTWHQYLDHPRTADGRQDSQRGSGLGPRYDEEEILSFLRKRTIAHTLLTKEELPTTVAHLLASEKVVAWFQGPMEFGPRALGYRSILADARSPQMQEQLNLKIKFREGFRPFAPSVMAERASDYFDFEGQSPYMLLVAPIKEGIRRTLTPEEQKRTGIDKLKVVRSSIPAVTHVDYSARIQTVEAEHNGAYHQLLSAFQTQTGCPVIVNTSFNVRGEPIVCTLEDAYRCFMKTNIDCLILGTVLVEKPEGPLEEASFL